MTSRCSVGLVQLDSIQMIIPSSHKPKITISQAPALEQVITSVTSTHVRHCISSRPQGYLSIGAHQPGDWNWSRLLQATWPWKIMSCKCCRWFSHVFPCCFSPFENGLGQFKATVMGIFQPCSPAWLVEGVLVEKPEGHQVWGYRWGLNGCVKSIFGDLIWFNGID